jgi:hypothetical protein
MPLVRAAASTSRRGSHYNKRGSKGRFVSSGSPRQSQGYYEKTGIVFDSDALREDFAGMVDEITDLTEVWPDVVAGCERMIDESFSSNGGSLGRVWSPLNKKYNERKTMAPKIRRYLKTSGKQKGYKRVEGPQKNANTRTIYPNQMLVRTGMLKNSFGILDITDKKMHWGTDLEYAMPLITGAKNGVKYRRYLACPKWLQDLFLARVQKHTEDVITKNTGKEYGVAA